MKQQNKPLLRILYNHRTMGRGAEGVHIRSIVEAFQQLGHSVELVSPPGITPLSTAGERPLDKSKSKTRGINSLWKAISRHAPQFLFEFIEIIYNIFAYFRLAKILRGGTVDFIYERYAFFSVAGAYLSRRYHIPLALEVNEVSGHQRARGQTFLSLCGMMERYVFSRAHAIFTVSSQLQNDVIQQRGNNHRVIVIPNAISPVDLVPLTPQEQAELRAQYGLSGSRTIGFVGWFDEWDRLDFLIDVFAGLTTVYEDAKLVFIGDGPMRPSLEELAKRNNIAHRVVFTGPIERRLVFRHMRLLDIAVLPHSNAFGSPVVLFELMGMRVPVVAPRLRPIEDVLEDRFTGLLFHPLDKLGLAECIKMLLDDSNLYRSIQEKSYAQVLNRHTWRANAENIINIMVSH
ncbi:MAG: glycosyltransferase family 4 protein [Desulfobulbaceae bacterium]|nr:glycosyltransferase family 4 protein [Desulfobulbaceae bacterium]